MAIFPLLKQVLVLIYFIAIACASFSHVPIKVKNEFPQMNTALLFIDTESPKIIRNTMSLFSSKGILYAGTA
jgi:hypothetical protein